jgi:hypothetical protein
LYPRSSAAAPVEAHSPASDPSLPFTTTNVGAGLARAGRKNQPGIEELSQGMSTRCTFTGVFAMNDSHASRCSRNVGVGSAESFRELAALTATPK